MFCKRTVSNPVEELLRCPRRPDLLPAGLSHRDINWANGSLTLELDPRYAAPRVFLWTFGAFLILHIIVDRWQIGDMIQQGQWIVLMIAGLVGLVPESGPHLIFVTMFAKGVVPFSVLLTSSIVQDGHGMLPLLAHSRRAFVAIKLINLVVGLLIGSLLMLLGN